MKEQYEHQQKHIENIDIVMRFVIATASLRSGCYCHCMSLLQSVIVTLCYYCCLLLLLLVIVIVCDCNCKLSSLSDIFIAIVTIWYCHC